jgi:antirestriction protein ArdC
MATVYEIITERILEQLEAGTVPWTKPWNGEAGMPRNLVSGKAYRGINVFLLHSLGYESPWFLTFKQATNLGGQVRKGEKGCPVVFWRWPTEAQRAEAAAEGKEAFPIVRYYTLFNVAQCDDIEVPDVDVPEREHEPLHAAESIVDGMPQRPPVEHGFTGASYSPTDDLVRMPNPERFEARNGYYATLFHELTHSTGHCSRLDRKLDSKRAAFGSGDYSREELLAEMGSAFLCGEAGILNSQVDRSASYIAGWLGALRNDRRLVVMAGALAQKSADYILDREQP